MLIEKSRALNMESIDIRSRIIIAKETIQPEQKSFIGILENQLQSTEQDSSRLQSLEKLAGNWYELGYPEISGYYAEEIARIRNNEESWSIAGTTFALGLKSSQEQNVRDYCVKHAIAAFENAQSLNPQNLDHQINMALVYTEAPMEGEPMKGIQMLLGLNRENPDNIAVLNQLGRLAIQTRQFDRAEARLKRVLELDENNKTANCLLAEVMQGLNEQSQASFYLDKCNSLK